MSDIVLVTGATGLIGRHVVHRLLAERRTVRVLLRGAWAPGGVPRSVQVVRGDVRDRVALTDAVRGAHTVLHLAGCARAWARDPSEFAAVNVHAVEMLLEAAYAAGVERVVHVSTAMTLPVCRNGSSRPRTPYEQTKLLGERLVDSYAAQGRYAAVVHPTRVYGPGPLNDANGVTRVIRLCLRSPVVPRLDDGDVQANYVHVADVAVGIVLAARRGRSGAHYVLGGENTPFRGLVRLVSELSGRRPALLSLPPVAALATAFAAQLWGRLGGRPIITVDWIRAYLEDHRVDVTPTCVELGYEPRPLRQGLEETIRWLRRRDLPAA